MLEIHGIADAEKQMVPGWILFELDNLTFQMRQSAINYSPSGEHHISKEILGWEDKLASLRGALSRLKT